MRIAVDFDMLAAVRDEAAIVERACDRDVLVVHYRMMSAASKPPMSSKAILIDATTDGAPPLP